MVLAQPFTTTSPVQQVIDWKDVESGLGYVEFFAGTTYLSTGAEYILSDDVFYSADINTLRSAAGTSTLTFDSSPLNVVRTAAGTAIFSCGIAAIGTNLTVTARLAKWDGSAATYISDTVTSQTFTGAAAPNNEKQVTLQLPLTETIIREGEQIRLIVTFQTSNANTGEIGHDPMGRNIYWIGDTTQSTTIMSIKVPFKTNE